MPQRKNAFRLTTDEQKIFIDAVTAMIADGTYASLVHIHAKHKEYRMHSMGTPESTLRFLPWHRAYLLHMEAELVKKNKDAFIPYWKWVDGGVPPWLAAFAPTVDGGLNQRTNLTASITNQARIDFLTNTITDYPTFTRELESDPHNRGHVMLGSPMESVPIAPRDPIFWMHHGEVDRVWSLWQANNKGKGPILSGQDAIMSPWTESVSDLASITKLGYSYV